jgi:hypothetical protein
MLLSVHQMPQNMPKHKTSLIVNQGTTSFASCYGLVESSSQFYVKLVETLKIS